MEDRCVCCGAIIPEGRRVCECCENNYPQPKRETVYDILKTHSMSSDTIEEIFDSLNNEAARQLNKFMNELREAIDRAVKEGMLGDGFYIDGKYIETKK